MLLHWNVWDLKLSGEGFCSSFPPVEPSVIQFGCGGTCHREVSVGDNGKFGMAELALFGTSAVYVSSVATFSSGIFSEQPPHRFGYRHHRVCSSA